VTSKQISLGYLTDLTGPAATQGKSALEGTQLFLQQLNSSGGVCGRQIKLTVQDDSYDPQKALSLYQQTEPHVLGILATLGTPVLATLAARYRANKVMTLTLGWDYINLNNPYLIVAPSTSDMDVVAGLSYLNQKGLLTRGDTIGMIAMQGLGVTQEPGAQYVAKKLGLKVRTVEVSPTTTDLSSQMQQFKNAGADAIIVAGLPTQTANVAVAGTALDFNVPIVTGTAGFVPQIMSTSAAAYLEANLYAVFPWAGLGQNNPEAKKVTAALVEHGGGVAPDTGALLGWAEAQIYTDIIGKSCGQLTRDGLQAALRSTTDLKVPGLMGDLDLSDPSKAPSAAYNIFRPDTSVVGDLSLVSKPFEIFPLVKSYKSPAK
jgi:ABC-type branched-subunit amino acid transport system substrate-binding protein